MNVEKLKEKITDSKYSLEQVSEFIGIDRSTLYRKLSKGESLTIKQANKIVEMLKLTPEEATAIFFPQYVA